VIADLPVCDHVGSFFYARSGSWPAEGWAANRHSMLKENLMKGDERMVGKLDELLSDELTAIMQYVVHAEMSANWGYDRLHEAVEKRAMQEMHHAKDLIERIIFLEGTPSVNRLNQIHIGGDVPTQFQADLDTEMRTAHMYNEAIHLADEVGDGATRSLLESILKEEDHHIDWLEEQLDQLKQFGVPLYLSTQNRS
jgi:bacterioferritin